MRSTVIVVSAGLIMLLGVYGSLVILLDEDRLKLVVAEHVQRHTDRRIDIRGPLKISLFPGLRLSAESVVMSGPPGFEGPALFSAERLEMRVRLLPLIRGVIDAREVQLRGAAVNLHTDAEGVSSLDGLADSARPNRGRGWSTGPISLDDVVVNLSQAENGGVERFEVDRIEFAGFMAGSPLQFRFQGNIGEPGIFDDIRIDGLLVAAENGRMRLSNMRMDGSLAQGHYAFEVHGNVSLAQTPPLNLALDGGRLRINEHEFEVNLDFGAAPRPSLVAELGARELTMNVGLLLDQVLALPYEGADSARLIALRGMDFDLQFDIDQLGTPDLMLDSVSGRLVGEGGRVETVRLNAGVPGGHLSSTALLDLRRSDPELSAQLQLEAAELSVPLKALGLGWVPEGAGSLALDLLSERRATGEAVWTGSGEVEIWAGRWPLVAALLPQHSEPVDGDRFDLLRGGLEIDAHEHSLVGLELVSGELVFAGRLSVAGGGEQLGGELELTGPGTAEHLELQGSVARPEVIRSPFGTARFR